MLSIENIMINKIDIIVVLSLQSSDFCLLVRLDNKKQKL